MSTFYGAAGPTPRGRLSRKTSNGFLKTALLMEKLCRLDLAKTAGRAIFTDQEIARMVCRSVRYLNVLRGKKEYIKKRIELTTGISIDTEQDMEYSIQKHKAYMKMLLPDAMRGIADIIQSQPIDLAGKKLKLAASLEVLDREGSFPKISRTDAHLKVDHDYANTDAASRELLEALGGSPQNTKEEVTYLEALEINKKFSNSKTLMPETQEIAMETLDSMPLETEKVQ